MMKKIFGLYLMGLPFALFSQTPRILPLGNSITQADQTYYSYRFPLWQKLRNANASFDFIGTMNTNYGGNPTFPDPAFDKDHEGHRGWRADQLLAALPTWLGNYTPDIVLIHAGTNDMFMGNSVAGTVEELMQIIDVLRADNPEVSILLAKIIGTTAPENARIVELNSYIDGIAAAKNTAQSRVIVVDQYAGFDPSTDAYDGKHPNAAGEEKMAQKWFDALIAIMDVQPPTTPTGTGLTANFYNTMDLSGSIVLSRVDPQINFSWGYGSPAAVVNTNYFSARWTGSVEAPVSGNYIFSTVSDDGVRLWVNDALVINNWTDHGSTTNNSTSVALTAGVRYNIRMEYYEKGGAAVAKLLWTSPGQSQQAIPQGRLYPSAPVGDTQPPTTPTSLSSSNVTQTSFTLSWTASTDNQSVTGYEVFLNGASNGTVSATTKIINGLSPATVYAATVRARDAAGNWSAQSNPLSVTTAGGSTGSGGTGLSGVYYNTIDLTGSAALSRVEPQVNFSWGYGSPGPAVNTNDFSARWAGFVEAPVSGNYMFSTVSDDGVRLWLNDLLVVNNWTDHGSTTNNSHSVALTAGVRYNIRMEYYEKGGAAVARLLWTYPGQSQQAIPQESLYPPTVVADNEAPSTPTSLSSSNITQGGFTLSWTASTDNKSVTSYEVFLNGISNGTVLTTTKDISGLSPATVYAATVRARDAAGNWSAHSNALSVTTAGGSIGGGTGLSGAYYNTIDLSGPVVLSRVEQVNFDWRYSSPGSPVNVGNFSVRWSGSVEAPVSGNYIFSTISDDGVRFWVNNVSVIDNWTDHGSTTNNSSPVALTAGTRYTIRMEYYEKGGVAVASLHWTYPGHSRHAIPVNYLHSEVEDTSPARMSTAMQSSSDEGMASAITAEGVPQQLLDLVVYPNPANADGIRIAFYSEVSEMGDVSAFSAHGARVVRIKKTFVEGYNVVEVATSDLHNGLYLVRVENGSRCLVARFVVAK